MGCVERPAQVKRNTQRPLPEHLYLSVRNDDPPQSKQAIKPHQKVHLGKMHLTRTHYHPMPLIPLTAKSFKSSSHSPKGPLDIDQTAGTTVCIEEFAGHHTSYVQGEAISSLTSELR